MEKYETPVMEIIEFEAEDIITSSSPIEMPEVKQSLDGQKAGRRPSCFHPIFFVYWKLTLTDTVQYRICKKVVSAIDYFLQIGYKYKKSSGSVMSY